MAKFRILLADDSLAVRRALRDLLCGASDNWVVCGEAADGQAAVQAVGELLPDVILLDLSLPVVPGLKVAQIVKLPATCRKRKSSGSRDAAKRYNQGGIHQPSAKKDD